MALITKGYRLEPRARQVDFRPSLRAEIHDPLWMLTRQWQFGEFKGEDAGSPLMAHYQVESAPITHFQSGDGKIRDLDALEALEPVVEHRKGPMDYRTRLHSARYWQQLLQHHPDNLLQAASWLEHLNFYQNHYPIPLPEIGEDDDRVLFEKGKLLVNDGLQQYLRFAVRRSFDGLKLYEDLVSGIDKIDGERKQGLERLFADKMEAFQEIADQFLSWYRERYGDPARQVPDSWAPERLEYHFACAAPGKDQPAVLYAEEYQGGRMDWYAFDLMSAEGKHQILAEQAGLPANNQKIISSTRTLIPNEVTFVGMPKARWWELEDGNVNFAAVNADTSDLGKILLTQFALQYSNDWYVLPIELDIGALHQITGIVVKDTFGVQTLISATAETASPDWSGWQFFKQDLIIQDPGEDIVDSRLFLPPALPNILESEPVESVFFIRDEMANMVWGIEDRIADGMGQGMDGHAAANDFRNWLSKLEPPNQQSIAAPEAVLKYTLFRNTTTENWIPFIPVRTGDRQRDIRLQRAAIPRFFKDNIYHIRPRTELLRHGLNVQKLLDLPLTQLDDDQAKSPYFINEEEVLKTGIVVQGRNQRSRWLHGRELEWFGYQKRLGRANRSGGFGFDQIEPVASS